MSLSLNLKMAQRASLIFLNIVVEAGYSPNSTTWNTLRTLELIKSLELSLGKMVSILHRKRSIPRLSAKPSWHSPRRSEIVEPDNEAVRYRLVDGSKAGTLPAAYCYVSRNGGS